MPEQTSLHISDTLADLKELVARPPSGAGELAGDLREIYASLYLTDLSAYDLDLVRDQAPELLEGIFALRLALRSAVAAWDADGLMTRDVQACLRSCLRASRYAGDMIGEVHLGHPRLSEAQAPYTAFGGTSVNLQVNPAFAGRPLDLMPGDVVLQRGMLHNSAAIARIGDVDSQFSHVGIVARDADQRLVMVEALIEDGAVIRPLELALSHGVGRAILFRHRDGALAARAAEHIHALVASSLDGRSRRILYDFSMRLDGYQQLYCSKLVRYDYALAAPQAPPLPRFTTLLDMANPDFPKRIGVRAKETFAPGDLELDPAFDVVAEWRDFRVTSQLRLKDLLMTKLFEWMDHHSYRFEPDLTIRAVALLGRLSTHLGTSIQEAIAEVLPKVPPNMRASAIGAVAMLHRTAEPIYRELQLLEDEAIRATGRQLHPRQVFEALERIRRARGSRIGYLRARQRSGER